MLEVMPQSGADERMARCWSRFSNCPPAPASSSTCSPRRTSATSCASYANLRVEDEDQAEKAKPGAARRATTTCSTGWPASASSHLLQGAQSLTAGFHYTIRDFRLMMSVALPGGDAAGPEPARRTDGAARRRWRPRCARPRCPTASAMPPT